MSLKAQAWMTCTHCGKKSAANIYKSINVAQDAQLKAKVLSGEIFLSECPECGAKNLLAYECLYHDPEEKYMIWMLPSGEPEGLQMEAIRNQTRAMGDYRLRVVANPGELMEKVMIFDAGLSDRCIELVKYVALKELDGVSNLHFYRIQDDVMVFSGVKEGPDGAKMDGFGFGLNVYEDCEGILRRNEQVDRENGFERIDALWVASILK